MFTGPLRRALSRMNAGHLATSLIPENMDNNLSYSVLNYLKRLKNQAKVEYDRIVSLTPHKGKFGPDGIKVLQKSSLKIMESVSGLRDQVTDFPGYMLGLPQQKGIEAHPLRNPFDIGRSRLLDQLVRMRANLIGGGRGRTGVQMVDSDTRHSLPIGTMGNYQDYLKKQPMPLRELESQPVRQHMFGNPFKINKNLMMTDEVAGIGGVDEVQIVGVAGQGGQGVGQGRGVKRQATTDPSGNVIPAPPKRRKGALPKDFQYMSPSSSPAHSVEYPTPPPSPLPSSSPSSSLTTTNPSSTPQPPPPPLQVSSSAKPTLSSGPMTNGITVSGGVGPVYSSGKMAAFKSICDKDLDSDGEDTLAIVEDLGKVESNNKMNDEDEDDIHVVNHVMDNISIDNPVSLEPVPPVAINASQKNDKVPVVPVMTNGDHDTATTINNKKSTISSATVSNVLENNVNTSHSVNNTVLSAEELRSIRLRNNNVRQLIYKEVKKPGKIHGELWDMLSNLQGPPWIRRDFIKEVKLEAMR